MNQKVETYYRLAIERFHSALFDESIEAFKSLLKLDFNHMDAHYYIALAYQQIQNYELSNTHLKMCQDLGLGTQNITKHLAFNYIQMALYKDAIFILQKYLHDNAEDHEAYAQLGDIYLAQQELHFAIQMYQKASKIAPKKVDYYIQLAKLLKQDKPFEGITQAQKALALEDQNIEALRTLASLFAQTDQHEKATIYYREALAYNLDDPMIHNNLALSYHALKNLEKAKTHLYIAIELSPENKNFQKNLKLLHT